MNENAEHQVGVQYREKKIFRPIASYRKTIFTYSVFYCETLLQHMKYEEIKYK